MQGAGGGDDDAVEIMLHQVVKTIDGYGAGCQCGCAGANGFRRICDYRCFHRAGRQHGFHAVASDPSDPNEADPGFTQCRSGRAFEQGIGHRVALDAVSLLRTVLDGPEARRLKASGPVGQLYRASLMLVCTLEKTFLPGDPRDPAIEPDRSAMWRSRCADAVAHLGGAGLPVTNDRASAGEAYVTVRAEWDQHIARLAPALGYEMAEIDTAGASVTRRSVG